MISIITPTHNPEFLKELEPTILAQTHKDWEWLILLNHGAMYEASDPRIRITESPFDNDNVGFLKKLACMQVQGDIIAEVDHDDLLTPDALAKVVEAFQDPEVGFVFSRNAKLTKRKIQYLPEYGWIPGEYRYKGNNLYAPFNQPVYPGRLGYIWFAPDHIRAWRKSVYEEIGGHNDKLPVCDDLDLMHRMYLVTKFVEIPEVLYIYRYSDNNTYVARKEQVNAINERLYDENVGKLADRYADLNNLLKIDLGTGVLLKDLPNNSCGVVRADNVLQYVSNIPEFMGQLHRVLAPGGLFMSLTPSTDGRGGFMDPEAVSYLNECSFYYYTKPWYANKLRSKILFRECAIRTVYPDEFSKDHKIPYVMAHLEKLI